MSTNDAAGSDGYRSDYKTDDPNWYSGFNSKISIRDDECAVRIKQMHPNARPPLYKTAGAAGMDLCACEALSIPPQSHAMVRTGIALAIPAGLVGLVCPRSGLAADRRVTVLNAPGVIDSDYRGELKVLLVNHGNEDFDIEVGDRIAQLVITHTLRAVMFDDKDLGSTERGTGGFGSTGR